jgi:serine/threonine-protein kinase
MLIGQKSQSCFDEPYPSYPLDGELREISPTANMPLADLIEKYRVLAKVQETETEVLFRAESLPLNKDVFLWIFDPAIIPPGSYERSNREILISQLIAHENIATQYDLHAIEDGPYVLVTEALAGVRLTDVMKKERTLRPKRAIQLARQICYALQAAHKQGIYHGALNPRYLFVSTDHQGQEKIKLCSFGIAKLIAQHKLALVMKGDESKVSLRDLAYIAPEHTQRSNVNILDECMEEIYSLGVLLYEMLAGELPFQTKTAQAMLAARNGAKVAPIRDRNPDFDLYALLDASVLRALAKDGYKRYQSIEEFLSKLDELFEEVDQPKSAIKIDVSVEFSRKRRPVPEPVTAQPERISQPATAGGQPLSAPARVPVCAAPAMASLPTSGVLVPAAKSRRSRSRKSLLVTAMTSAIMFVLLTLVLDYSVRRVSARLTPTKASAASAQQPSRFVPVKRLAPLSQDQSSATKPAARPAAYVPRRVQPRNQRQELSTALDNWITTMNARDIGSLETFYMPELSIFYGARNVAQEDVLTRKARLFREATRLHVGAHEPKITINEDGTATIHFRKPYLIKSKQRTLQGEALQEMHWMKTDEGWKIASEHYLKTGR